MLRVVRSLFLVALLATVAVACGDDDDDGNAGGGNNGGDDGGSETVSVEDYATDVCQAGGDWRETLEQETQQLTTDAAEAQSDLDAMKQLAQGYFDEVIAASDDLLDEIEEAGIPDTDDGEEIAEALRDGFAQVKEEFEDAAAEVDELETTDRQQFGTELQRIGTDLQSPQTLGNAFQALEKYEDSEVSKEFDENATCKEFNE